MKYNKKMACVMPILYVIFVSIIPILGIDAKGTQTNTLVKFCIFFIFCVYYFYISNLKLKISITGICIISLYCLSQIAAFLNNKDASFMNIVSQVAILIIIFGVFPKIIAEKENICKGLWLYVVFNIIAIVYNFIKYIDRFINLSVFTSIYYDMYSFFDNKNTYGMVLFIGLVFLYYLLYIDYEHTKLVKFLIVLQFISICVSMCRTSLVCSFVIIIGNLLKNLSNKKVVIFLLIIFIMGIMIMFSSNLQNFILYHLFRVDVGTYREVIVDGSKYLFQQKPIFGYGEGGWSILLKRISGNEYSHNGYYSILLIGGITYFIAYIGMWFWGLKLSNKICKKNNKLGWQIRFFYFAFFVYSFFEAVILCGTSAANFSFCIAGLIMPILIYNCEGCV